MSTSSPRPRSCSTPIARKAIIILADARNLALAHGLELVEDEGLLEEVAGLVEWPVTLMGEFESAFLDIPPEVIRATIRANQKCFVLRSPDGRIGAPSRPAPIRTRQPNSSYVSEHLISRATTATRSRRAMGGSCVRASPMRAISG